MIVIIPKNQNGADQITLIKRIIIIMDELDVVWNKRKSYYPRLNSSNKRGKSAEEEIYRTIINKYNYEDILIDVKDNLFNILFKQLCYNRKQSIEYYLYNMNNKTLCLVDEWINNPISNDDYYVIISPSQELIENKMLEFFDKLNNTVDQKLDCVRCIKSKIDQFELTVDNKIELIKYILI